MKSMGLGVDESSSASSWEQGADGGNEAEEGEGEEEEEVGGAMGSNPKTV